MPRLLLPAASATRHLSLSHFHVLPLLLLSTPLSHLGLITAPYSTCTLVSLLCVWAASSGLYRTAARLIGGNPRTGHVSAYMLDVLHWLPIHQQIIFHIGTLVWRCILVLLRPTSEIFTIPPRAPEVAVLSAHWNRGYFLFLLLVPLQPRPVHSRWLAPLCGIGFLWRNDCSPGFFLTHSSPVSKPFLTVQGS